MRIAFIIIGFIWLAFNFPIIALIIFIAAWAWLFYEARYKAIVHTPNDDSFLN